MQAIWESPRFQVALEGIERAERDRVYCRHGFGHLLDVARIAWILNLERGCAFERELVYAAALLHDIGRGAQYATGEPHDEAGSRVAAAILDELPAESRFPEREREAILAAVRGHRGAACGGSGDARGAGGDTCGNDGDARGAGGDTCGNDGFAYGGAGDVRGCRVSEPEVPLEQLAQLISEADGLSRPCYACPAREGCYWTDERKNLKLDI
ncbi:MAG: HD domain-containing protein [Coriobacteriaceae bacterium]|nr:HD domain-containing protein [Coriobacteriaceae bacterium]